ncbi:patatin-like phospholipase family protein [Algicella marina]|uniref:Patatin-like phospholipase family protein n=1 Tax=Algicella marina TaxID=2683284 RepID=A0A6P1T087_9RHOB|nr:patatin-like phospholipase family protein [Algicella marina]QHQ34699.1 patatin-like phospholipase family protein [Algicella marina]
MTIKLNLALQGGGAHGAFTWGVLDRLLEEDDIEIEGITATSAGAMNAAAIKSGWVQGGNEGARAALDAFWQSLSSLGSLDVLHWFEAFTPSPAFFARTVERSPAFLAADAMTRMFSPYELNPLNIHPLRPLVEEFFDFDDVCSEHGPKLFISATNVRSGKIKVFSGKDIGVDPLLASACLPTLYQAVEIPDEKTGEIEAYWDGGYLGNPALFPLFYETETSDILIVHINPIHRDVVPHTAIEIMNRINEISFNSSLLRELRAIDFVKRLIEDGAVSRNTMKDVFIHSVMDDDLMNQLSATTKLTPNRQLLDILKVAGRSRMDEFMAELRANAGKRSSVDLRAMFS